MNPHTRYALLAYVDASGLHPELPLPTLTFADIYNRADGARAAVAMADPSRFYVFDLHSVVMLPRAPFVGPGAFKDFDYRIAALSHGVMLATGNSRLAKNQRDQTL